MMVPTQRYRPFSDIRLQTERRMSMRLPVTPCLAWRERPTPKTCSSPVSLHFLRYSSCLEAYSGGMRRLSFLPKKVGHEHVDLGADHGGLLVAEPVLGSGVEEGDAAALVDHDDGVGKGGERVQLVLGGQSKVWAQRA